MSKTIRIGTRDSELALWQAHTVQKKLNDLGYKTEIVAVKSQGDIILDKPLYELGITGIFTKTLDIAMLNDQVDNSLQVTGTLLVEERTYPLLQERLRHWPSDPNQDWEQLKIPLHLELSRQQLTLAELNNLEITDVILLSDNEFSQKQQLRLVLHPNTYCTVLFNSNNKSLTINSDWNTMTDQEQKHTIDNLNQVPIQLTFDIGQHTLSFNEIKQLRAGYVIELSTPLPEIVQIRAQNKLLGTGELVDINGRLGVRLLTIFGSKK